MKANRTRTASIQHRPHFEIITFALDLSTDTAKIAGRDGNGSRGRIWSCGSYGSRDPFPCLIAGVRIQFDGSRFSLFLIGFLRCLS